MFSHTQLLQMPKVKVLALNVIDQPKVKVLALNVIDQP